MSSPSAFLRPLPRELIIEQQTPKYSEGFPRRRSRREWSGLEPLRTRQREAPPGELTYDYSDSQDVPTLPELSQGARVRHPRFGVGTVAELDGAGWEVKAVIDFESVGRKKLVVKYANLDLV